MEEEHHKKRLDVKAIDSIIGEELRVLDAGFVRVIDYMGSDQAVVQSARISYGVGTKKVHEDRGLIRYLMRHRHTTPFEMCEIKLHVRVPMDCWRQWIRHRTANVNEYSTRYSEAIDAQQKTSPSEWRIQVAGNRQGSSETLPSSVGENLSKREEELQKLSRNVYQERLDSGVAREQARKDLPLSTYTEAYWKIDLHNLLHFLSLRMDQHAQQEIREYANVIGYDIVAKWCPIVWEAFIDYRLNAGLLSGVEWTILEAIIRGDKPEAVKLAEDSGLVSYGKKGLKKSREREEFDAKLKRLGIKPPWLPGNTHDSGQ